MNYQVGMQFSAMVNKPDFRKGPITGTVVKRTVKKDEHLIVITVEYSKKIEETFKGYIGYSDNDKFYIQWKTMDNSCYLNWTITFFRDCKV